MTVVAERVRYTPEDLLTMEDGEHYELVDGELVEREMSMLSSNVASRVVRILDAYVDERRLGWTMDAECGYQCFPDPVRIRRPDASFISQQRLPSDRAQHGHVRIPPDLVVEVVSPTDLMYKVERKVREYLAAGVRLVWVFSPEVRTVYVYRLGGRATVLGDEDILSGEDVVPGFSSPVADFFPPREDPEGS